MERKLEEVLGEAPEDTEMLDEAEKKEPSHSSENHTQHMVTIMRGRIPDTKVEINNSNRAAFRARLIDALDNLSKGDLAAADFFENIKQALGISSPTRKSG